MDLDVSRVLMLAPFRVLLCSLKSSLQFRKGAAHTQKMETRGKHTRRSTALPPLTRDKRRQGTVIVVAIPNEPGDWKSTAQSEPLPAPPFMSHPAPSRTKYSSS